MNQPALSVPSFAKINWNLQILGKRPDGYHEVSTLLQTISLHDDIHFELSEHSGVTLSCDDPAIPTDETNLIVRAATALRDHYGIDRGVSIRLEKRIPAQGGLGGASSNAAVTLLALVKLWNVDANVTALLEIAAGLGADVPFFLLGGCARATGVGATLSTLPNQTDDEVKHLIVITPNARVSTPRAYAAMHSPALTTSGSDLILSSSHTEANFGDSQPWPLQDSLNNDFESVIFDIEPEIRRTKETLLQAGALGGSIGWKWFERIWYLC